jgi:hypothetical protein
MSSPAIDPSGTFDLAAFINPTERQREAFAAHSKASVRPLRRRNWGREVLLPSYVVIREAMSQGIP